MDFKEYYVGERDTEEEAEFRQEVRDFLDEQLTPDVLEKILEERDQYYEGRPHAREFSRKLGAKGWLVPQWPKEYGGLGSSPAHRRIIIEELSSRGASAGGGIATSIVGPVIMLHGTEEQKREFLPKIARGDIEMSLGYSEPNAGTDLASLEMRAVPDGDDYVINGQKIYSTGAHEATHHWLAARTSADAPRHRGISLFVVDLASPGVNIRPLLTMAGERTNEVFYDDVRVPRKNRIGEENQGWGYIREALGFERIALSGMVNVRRIVDELVQYVKETEHGGKPLAEDPIVRQSLAQLAIESNIRRLFGHRTSWLMSKGIVPDVAAAIAKVWGNELDQRVANAGMQILGLYSQLEPDSKWAPLRGSVEHLYRFAVHLTYGGGSHELMRSLIATRGMNLPREPRM
jgi:alkylation response protein AidB-like acyl-CoA dehydrogenase